MRIRSELDNRLRLRVSAAGNVFCTDMNEEPLFRCNRARQMPDRLEFASPDRLQN